MTGTRGWWTCYTCYTNNRKRRSHSSDEIRYMLKGDPRVYCSDHRPKGADKVE